MIAKNKDRFLEIGVIPIVSKYEAVELAFDKYEMYKYLISNGFKTAKTYINKEDFYQDLEKKIIDFPVFVKPVRGSASLNISKVTCKKELDLLFELYDELDNTRIFEWTRNRCRCIRRSNIKKGRIHIY